VTDYVHVDSYAMQDCRSR